MSSSSNTTTTTTTTGPIARNSSRNNSNYRRTGTGSSSSNSSRNNNHRRTGTIFNTSNSHTTLNHDLSTTSLDDLEQLVKHQLITLPETPLPGSDRTMLEGITQERKSYTLPKFAYCAAPFIQEIYEQKSNGRTRKYLNVPLPVQKYIRELFNRKNEEIKELKAHIQELDPSLPSKRTSRFRGVNRNGSGWSSSVNKKRYSGTFPDEISAAVNHDKVLLDKKGLKALCHLNFKNSKDVVDFVREKKNTPEFEEQLTKRGRTIFRGVTIDKKIRDANTDGTHFKSQIKKWWSNLSNETTKNWPKKKGQFVAEYGSTVSSLPDGAKRVTCTVGRYSTPEEAAYAINEVAWMVGDFARDNPEITWEKVNEIRRERETRNTEYLRTWLQNLVKERAKQVQETANLRIKKFATLKKKGSNGSSSGSGSSSNNNRNGDKNEIVQRIPAPPSYTIKQFEEMSPFGKFKAQYIEKNWADVYAINQRERSKLARQAWNKKHGGLPPYDVFCLEYEKEHQALLEGKSIAQKNQIFRQAYVDKYPKKQKMMEKNFNKMKYIGGAYKQFRLKYLQEHYSELSNKTRKEVTAIIKAAFQKEKGGKNGIIENKPVTPYMEFRNQWKKENADKIIGKTEKEITQMVKGDYKQSRGISDVEKTKYQAFRGKWISENEALVAGKKQSEVTELIKIEWHKQRLVQQIDDGSNSEYINFRNKWLQENRSNIKGKSKKKITKSVKAAWRKETGKVNVTPYVKFKNALLKKNKVEWQGKKEKEITALVKKAWVIKKKELDAAKKDNPGKKRKRSNSSSSSSSSSNTTTTTTTTTTNNKKRKQNI